MPEFLTLWSPDEALRHLLFHLGSPTITGEVISTAGALGRVVCKPIFSSEDLPAFPRSTVDGYALMASSTYGASDTLPAYLTLVAEVFMGMEPDFEIALGQAALIHTGGMLPMGANAVVMLENTQPSNPGEIEVMKSVGLGENILLKGEDVTIGQEIIQAGTRLRPAEIGGLLALGLTEVEVAKSPKVAIISSGDEVIPPSHKPHVGQVRDINTYTLANLITENGGQAISYGIVPDSWAKMRSTLAQALKETDLVVVTAGSSASSRDLTASVIQEMGEPGVLVHGVNVRPGKPTILAVCDGKPVIGLPGNPVSALVIARLFVIPVIEKILGLHKGKIRPSVQARISINIPSQAGREDWVPVKLVIGENGYQAEPIFFKSNLIFMLAQADGLIHIPPAATGVEVGEVVQVELI